MDLRSSSAPCIASYLPQRFRSLDVQLCRTYNGAHSSAESLVGKQRTTEHYHSGSKTIYEEYSAQTIHIANSIYIYSNPESS